MLIEHSKKTKKHLKKLEFIYTTTMHHQNIHIQKDANVLKKLQSHKYLKEKIENFNDDLFHSWLQNDLLSQLVIFEIIK